MRGLFISAALMAAVAPGAALAQYQPYQPYKPYSSSPTPAPKTTYDRETNSTYRTTPTYDGGARVTGYNYDTGAQWQTKIKPNGNQSGTDAQGNSWNYNARSGSYYNSNGTTCYGKGAARTCN